MAKKRLSDLELRRNLGDEKAGTTPSTSTATYEPPISKMVTTTIHIPEETLDLLKRANAARMILRGSGSSVSKLIAELVERQRDALEAEIKAAKDLL